MGQCTLPFTNAWGIVDPELGQLKDNRDAFRRWQRRVLSYAPRRNYLRDNSSQHQHRRARGRNQRGARHRHDSGTSANSQAIVPRQARDAPYGNAGHRRQYRQQPHQTGERGAKRNPTRAIQIQGVCRTIKEQLCIFIAVCDPGSVAFQRTGNVQRMNEMSTHTQLWFIITTTAVTDNNNNSY